MITRKTLRQVVHPIGDGSAEKSRERQRGPRERAGVSVQGRGGHAVRAQGEREREGGQDGLGGQFILLQLGLL